MSIQASTVVSDDEFIYLMNEMKWKAIKNLGQPFRRNLNLTRKAAGISARLDSHAAITTRDAATDAIVDQLKNTVKSKGQSTSDTIQNSVTDSTTEYQKKLSSSSDASAASDDWLKDMDEEEKVAQTTAANNIHQSFNKAKELGIKHPEARSGIKAVMHGLSNFFNGIISKISEFLFNIADKVANFIKQAWEAITNTFNKVKDFITGFF